MIVWSPPFGRGQGLRCGWTHPNPEPRPACTCPRVLIYGCECEASDWSPILKCGRELAYRVVFPNGGYYDACSPAKHTSFADAAEWIRLVTVRWESEFDGLLKYYYRDEDILALANRRHPFLNMVSRQVRLEYKTR